MTKDQYKQIPKPYSSTGGNMSHKTARPLENLLLKGIIIKNQFYMHGTGEPCSKVSHAACPK